MRLGGIEAGGTKFVCGIGNEHGEIEERVSFPTTTPEETLQHVVTFFQDKKIDALGVGAFGPVDLDKKSPTYGYIMNTPKLKWKGFDLIGALNKHFSIPIGFDTDVNGAALGEQKWGAAVGVNSSIYMTVGTGIGVGAVVEGKLLHGLAHPDMGHISLKRYAGDSFEGWCPYHQDCLEGLAAGPAIEKRWEKKGHELENKPEVWALEAYYLAQAVANYILILSPEKVILGGGVMHQKQLFPLIHEQVKRQLNGYISKVEVLDAISDYIVPPGLGDNAGLAGSLALALNAYEEETVKG